MVECVHLRKGVIMRVDQHMLFLKSLEELATKLKTGQKQQIQETKNGTLDRLLDGLWPGDAKDVEVISSPLSENSPSPEFNAVR